MAVLSIMLGLASQESYASKATYKVNVDTVEHSWVNLPGESIALQADVYRDGKSGEDPQYDYKWELIKGGSTYTTLSVDPQDHSKVLMTFLETGKRQTGQKSGSESR